ncbi:MAG TPA: MEDS domain-containing protein [Noviherbaspirillum sp.]|nr:MEDS domain-containing protein [Noviherbaspirillum sp.]
MDATRFEHFTTNTLLAKTPSGISCCGELHWGSHFCHLYETREDLIDTLVPFFSAGLINNDKCLWVTSAPLDAAAATAALAEKMPDFALYLSRGQIQIIDYPEWYTRIGKMDADSVLQSWVGAEQQALAEGFSGLRVTGNVTFIKSREEWRAFDQYEARVAETFAGRRIIGLCSYHLGMANGNDILDVVRNHEFALARREGVWQMIENAAVKLAKQELQSTNARLEQRVEERTIELRNALATVEEQKRELEAVLQMRDESQRQLEAELADAQLLHSISATLINEGVVGDFYQKLVDAAALVMRSDFASMQRFDPERGALQIIAHRGFEAEALAFWEWVPALRPTSCGMALHRHERFIVPDFEAWEYAAGSEDLAAFQAGGVRAAQSTPLLSRSGTLVGMISTHWKRPHQPAERDLRLLDIIARQAADLIERNAAAEALQEQTERLLEADRRKDVFLATLAHELRNPLAPIQTGLAVLKIGKPENMQRVLTMMERQLSHMVRLIDELLDVSRVSRGLVTLKRERVKLNAIIDSAIETSRPLLEAARHQLTVTLPTEAVWMEVDATRVAQVLSNLLNNAAKYTPEGGRIELVAESIGAEVRIRVTDTGIGIPAEMLQKIFDLFTRVDEAVERSQSGLGVGLSLARQLAELHGGSIAAASEGVGRGATFTVRLPACDAPQEVMTGEEGESRVAGKSSTRVLIVDDNADAAETLALLLEGLGHSTCVVCEAPKAMNAALSFQPEVAFLDLGMPQLNGFDLARQLREQPALASLVLVALSGWGSEEDRARGRNAGIDHHLTKPVLMNAVQGILDSIRTRRRA